LVYYIQNLTVNDEMHGLICSVNKRFAECAELLSVYFLAVIAEIAPEELSTGMRYAVYLVYKLQPRTTTGLKGFQTSLVRLYGERIVATNKVSVDPTGRGWS
jgi:hypothetical protein